MDKGWIQLQCPDCDEQWEANPVEMPEPGESMTCDHCGATHPASEFPQSKRELEVLEEFHE